MNPRLLLAPLAGLYGAGVTLHRALHVHGPLPVARPGARVISVGNLLAGGSGKSPLTIELVRRLMQRDPEAAPAVVSRGYGRASRGVQVVADESGVRLDAGAGGDEPVMIARALPGVPVVVAEKRAEGVARAQREFGARVAVLDDAFQHWGIARELDVVLLDASAPRWMWRLLPVGRMREPASALKRAGLIVVSGEADEPARERMERWAERFTAAPVAHGYAAASHLETVEGRRVDELASLRGMKLAAASTIARPRRLLESLGAAGAEVVLHRAWPDHARPGEDAWRTLIVRAREAGARMLVITAKDAVKWPAGLEPDALPVRVLAQRWQWLRAEPLVDAALAAPRERN